VCANWEAAWGEIVASVDPDIVVIHSATWDLLPRRLEGWDDFAEIGDPAFDDWLLSEYVRATEVLTATGAELVWLIPPCVNFDAPGLDGDQGAIDRLGRLLSTRLAPPGSIGVRTTDLAGRVCPDGRFSDSVEGVANARPDGIHFSDEAASRLSEWLGPEILGDA